MPKRDHTKLFYNVSELSGLFSDTTSLKSFLQKIVETVADHMQAAVCSIYLFYEDKQELVLTATKGLNPGSIGQVRLKLGEGLTGKAVKELRPICAENASTIACYRYFPELGEEAYESFLVVPILRGQSRIGAIVLQNIRKKAFNDEDVRAVRAITSQLANTIETAKILIGLNEGRQGPLEQPSCEDLKFVKGRVGAPGFAFAPCASYRLRQQSLRELVDQAPGQYTLKDFHRALKATEQQLKVLQEDIEERLLDVASLIFTAQLLMLKDPGFTQAIENLIDKGIAPPSAIVQVVEDYLRKLSSLPNDYLREKKYDVEDISLRLLENLLQVKREEDSFKGRIIIAQELFPSGMLKFASEQVAGVVLLSGGITSHISILARSLEIPVVIVEAPGLLNVPESTPVLLDGEQGNVYVRPGPEIVETFQAREKERARAVLLKDRIKPQTLTRDGTRVRLFSNINLLSDLKVAREYRSEGIGLYRTEFPFIVRSDFPSEEEQYVIYQKLVQGMPDKEVTFRTLDIGGDKVLSYYDYSKEKNPNLGMRSIRFSLRHEDIFVQQIRAILRAGAEASLKIMFPMISSLDEFLRAKAIVRRCMDELRQQNLPCHPSPRIGMMVELPALIEIIDDMAAEADFFSIGTNDFIQYLLAVDRANEKVADLYLPHHPSVLRALKKVVTAARRAGKDVSVCGDMAQEEKYLPYFLGIGLRDFSLDSHYLLRIQKACERIDLIDAQRVTQELLREGRIVGVERILSSSGTA